MNLEFESELKKFNEIIEKYNEVLDDSLVKLKNIDKLYQHSFEEMMIEKNKVDNKIKLITRGKLKPYFARIDFYNNINSINEKCYIGKVGVMDYDNKIVTVDWRAPISSLYYDSNIGNTSYNAPDGIITGELTLKRQYDIENGKFIGFNDVDSVSNDELLKPYLGVNADHRLKNIVATIQGEQNSIIREPLNKNIIVQGVAGSGKTTVALHRIAYLVYNNRDIVNNDQYIVIGPNKFFVNYISSVLPDLDVTGINQCDLFELSKNYIGEDFNINDDKEEISKVLKGINDNISEFKTSMHMKNLIDNFVDEFENKLFPNKNFEVDGFDILSREYVKSVYQELNPRFHKSLKARVDKTLLILTKYIKDHQESYIQRLNQYIDIKYIDEKENLEMLRKKREKIREEIKSGCTSYLKTYLKKINIKILPLYYDFIANINVNKDSLIEKLDFPELVKGNLNSNDLPAIMYMKYKIKGSNGYEKFKQVAIDEAQDYNDFTFYTLKKIFPNASFSIYGDLAQSLYSYRSIKKWESIMNSTFKNNVELKILEKSYRTTIEIMREANKINKHLNLNLAQPVIRHGKEVKYIASQNESNINIIVEIIESLYEHKLKTIAIISKTDNESQEIFNQLKTRITLVNINNNSQVYDGGICTITSHLSKGLEFDAVIINNVNENSFNSDIDLDMKLLYVSMTRALHELYIIYNKNLTKVLINEEKVGI